MLSEGLQVTHMCFQNCVLRARCIDRCAAGVTCGFVAPAPALFRPALNYRPCRIRLLRMTASTEPEGRVRYGMRIETSNAVCDNLSTVGID